jgi:hypothetical protein
MPLDPSQQPDRSPSDPGTEPEEEQEFERSLSDLSRSLEALKARYAQVQRDALRQAELGKRTEQVERDWKRTHLPELRVELRNLKAQIRELQVDLESALLSNRELSKLFWQGVKQGFVGEIFWSVVRFVGIGIVIGWLLKSCTG